MKVSARPDQPDAASRPRVQSDAAVKAASSWVAQLARTLKTCRLYDAANPTVVRFRDEFAQATQQLVGEHGAITFRFTADDVECDGVSLHPARSRDDNLAYPFHRDGVRGLTLHPGIEPAEVATLLDRVLAATGVNLDGDDLVTLLWEADLRHVDVDFIPAEGDVGNTSAPAPAEGERALLPWPEPEPAPANAAPDAPTAEARSGPGRSEDWTLGDLTVEVEASFVELDALAGVECERFRREFTDEHLVSPVTAALAIGIACLHANADDEDRAEIGRYLPRVLRGALGVGAWPAAREALRTLRSLRSPHWSEETFVQELLQPVSMQRVVERLDAQDAEDLGAFLALALEVGDAGVDWLTLALADSQHRATRQVLAEALAERCRENPERLASWLADGRWYVVRNMVCILGWIGGAQVVGLLQVAMRHPDARVHAQVVASLSQTELKYSRPLLVRALEGADTRLFCQVLSQLSGARDPATARFVFAFLQQDRFLLRPAEERRAIYAALASVGGDEIVPELEVELLRANWFDRSREIHRHNVARCLGRIGTAAARATLERAAQSRRAPVRHAATTALGVLPEAA